MIIYLAGKYKGNIWQNIYDARQVAIKLWEAGYTVICPHLNTANFEIDCTCEDDVFLHGYLEIVERCDAVVLLPGWQDSAGTKREINKADELEIPVYEWPKVPGLKR